MATPAQQPQSDEAVRGAMIDHIEDGEAAILVVFDNVDTDSGDVEGTTMMFVSDDRTEKERSIIAKSLVGKAKEAVKQIEVRVGLQAMLAGGGGEGSGGNPLAALLGAVGGGGDGPTADGGDDDHDDPMYQ